jgi:hypothetical protein
MLKRLGAEGGNDGTTADDLVRLGCRAATRQLFASPKIATIPEQIIAKYFPKNAARYSKSEQN